MKKRIICMVLAMVLILSMVPVTASAATTYNAQVLLAVNTNTSASSLGSGSFTPTLSSGEMFSMEKSVQEENTEEIQDIYVDEQTGQTMTVLAPNFDPLVLAKEPEDAVAKAASLEKTEATYYVGNTKTIYEDGYSKTVKCLYKGTYCTVWGSTTESSNIRISTSQAQQIGQKFDANYSKMNSTFGTCYDADGDGKIAILCHDIDSNYGSSVTTYTAGYFFAANMISSSGYINGHYFGSHEDAFAMDCIHLDTYPGMGTNLSDISRSYSTLFHEFQHAINFTYAVKTSTYLGQMETYMDEAFAMAAEHLVCGSSSASSRIDYFNDKDSYMLGYPLTYWAGDLDNYSNSYLFGQYIRTRYAQQEGGDGSSLFKAILSRRTSSNTAISIVAGLLGTTSSQLIKDFWAAVHCRQSSGKYGFNGESWANAINPLGYVGTNGGSFTVYNGGCICMYPSDGTVDIQSSSGVEFICINNRQVGGSSTPSGDSSRLRYISYPTTYVKDVTMTDNSYPWTYNTSYGRFESGNKGVNSTTSTTTLSFRMVSPGTLSFDYGVSSESGYDELTITLDGTTIVNGISGSSSSSITGRSLSIGTHTLTMSYYKDGSYSENSDLAWLKAITISVSCQHTSTRYTYTSLGNRTHTRKTVCSSCGEQISSTTQSCTDSNYDEKCDYCSGSLPCQHSSTRYTYTSLGDRTHTRKTVCSTCGDQITSITQSCTDSNNDEKCDYCSGNLPCLHGSTTTSCTYNDNWTHTTKQICQQCGDQVSAVTSNCSDTNNDKTCDVCGGVKTVAANACGESLTWSLNSSGVLTITGTGAMYNYSISDPAPWFDQRASIKTVVLQSGVATIGYYAFYDCSALTSVSFPSTLTKIDMMAFLKCSALTGVTIPASVQEIGVRAFAICEKLTSISVNSANTAYSSSDGVLFNKNKTELVQYPIGNTRQNYTVPDGVVAIQQEAFGYSPYLKQILLPDTLQRIDGYVFGMCTALESMEIPESVTEISHGVLGSCTSLKELVLHNTIQSIGNLFVTAPGVEIYYYGTAEEWNGIEIADNNDVLNSVTRHYMQATCTPQGDRTHISADTCSDCGKTRNAVTENCTDENGDFTCDVCDGDLPCEHTGTRSVRFVYAGSGVHNRQVCCDNCDVVLSSTQQSCTGTSDGVCDVCGGGSGSSTGGSSGGGTTSSDARIQDMSFGPLVSNVSISDNFYPWTYNSSYDRIQSGNYHCSSTTSTMTLTFKTGVAATLSFNYGVSSESGYDKLTITVDGTTVVNGISGSTSSSLSRSLSTGAHTVVLTYSKDGSVDSGSDLAWISNLRVTTTDTRVQYMSIAADAVSAIALTDYNSYAWAYDSADGRFESRNQSANSSTSQLTMQFTAARDVTLSFDYGVSSESSFDKLTITVDGSTVVNGISGSTTGSCTRDLSSGTHTVIFKYTKDSSQSSGSDIGWFKNLVISGCAHGNASTTYAPAENRMHTVLRVCTACDQTLLSTTQACTDSNKDFVCDLCGGDLPCLHTETAITTTPNGDRTHTKTTKCSDCDEIITSEVLSCTDSNTDFLCDTCGGDLPCLHPTTRVTYRANNDDLHTETTTCTVCSKTIRTVTEGCFSVDGDDYCDKCTDHIECKHPNFAETYTPTGSETHVYRKSCTYCGEVLQQSTAACVDGDINFKCDICDGAVSCKHLHTEQDVVYTSRGNETHIVNTRTVCTDCDEALTTNPVVGTCVDEDIDFKCDDCGGAVACKHVHTKQETTYAPRGDEKHTMTVKTICTDCDEALSATPTVGDCEDADVDFECDHCGGEVACKHQRTKQVTTYEPRDNKVHAVITKTICRDCDEELSETTSAANCVDEDINFECDLCGGEVPCNHLHVDVAYEDNNDGLSHTVYDLCLDCEEMLRKTGTEACSNDGGKCAVCGQSVECGHSSLEFVTDCESLGDESHETELLLVCGDCGETLSSDGAVEACADDDLDGECDICGGEVATEEVVASGTCGDNTRWEVTDTGRLIITGYGAVKNSMTSSLVPWKNYASKITEVVIAEGVTSIGNNAFKNCTNLTDVYFYGTQEQWDAITVGTNNAPLTAADVHFLSAACSHADAEIYFECDGNEETHTVVITCDICGEEVTSLTTSCSDGDSDSACDLCGGDLPCRHLRTETEYLSGDNVHTVTTTCVCGEVIESYLEDCADENGDELCDICGIEVGALAAGFCGAEADGTNLIWTLSRGGTLTISGTGAMMDYTDGGAPWYEYRDIIVRAVIGDGATTIGTWAFRKCAAMISVDLPESMELIGEHAFRSCTALSSVYIPAGVEVVEKAAFGSCDSLQKIQVDPDNVSYCDVDGVLLTKDREILAAYPAGHEQTDYEIPNSVTSIGDAAFLYAAKLVGVTIPYGVVEIGEAAFGGCSSLTDVVLPGSLTSLAENAFYRCSALESVVLPKELTTVGEYAFYYCDSLSDVYYLGDAEQAAAMSIGDRNTPLVDAEWHYMQMDYTSGENRTHTVTAQCPDCEVTLPSYTENCVDENEDGICDLCGDMGAVQLSGICGAEGDGTHMTWSLSQGRLTISGTGVMKDYSSTDGAPWNAYCNSVRSISVASGVTAIGKYAFYNCSKLTEATLPDGLTTLGSAAFRACVSLPEIEIPDTVTFIGSYCFRGCKALESAVIPDGITSLEYSTFGYCRAMTNVTIPDTVTNISSSVFRGCSALLEVDIPDGVKTIGTYAFEECSSLTSIEIPEGITMIEAFAFANCIGLTDVTVPGNVTTIGGSAFNGCTGLEALTIPNSVTSIGINALKDCSSLADVYYIGTAAQWETITVGDNNEALNTAEIHYMQTAYISCGDGMHMVTMSCTDCGAQRGEASGEPCQDADDDGICDRCGEEIEDVPVIEKFTFAGSNMTLGGDLKMNYMIKTVDLGSGTYTAKIYHNGETTEATFGRYNSIYSYVSYTVAAAQMADNIMVEAFDEDGNAVSEVYTTSVRTYAMNLLNKDSTNAKTKKLLVDMLNYGAAAQNNFSYNTSDPANANLTDAQKELATGAVSCTDGRVKGTNYYGSSLSLEGRILLNLYFRNVTSDMYAVISFTDFDGDVQSLNVPFAEFKKLSGSTYAVVVDDIVLAESFNLVTVTVYNADGTVHGTATDSVESYIARSAESELNAAIMKFAASAVAYYS